jgi:hypothetical protein
VVGEARRDGGIRLGLVPVESTPGVGGITVVVVAKGLANVLGQLRAIVEGHG